MQASHAILQRRNRNRQRPGGYLARLLLLSALCLLSCILTSYAQSPPGDDSHFVEALRARRLFTLAESYCRQQVDNATPLDANHARWTIELMRCYAEHAVHSPPQQRASHWQAAHKVARNWLATAGEHPRRRLVEMQNALTLLAEGELARQEAELSGGDMQTPLQTIRDAIEQLERMDAQLDTEIPLRHRRQARSGELTAEQLVTLQQNVRYQLARGYRNRALCYPPGSEDRIAALVLARQQLANALSQLAPDDPLALRMQVDQLVVSRLLGDFDRAAQLAGSLSGGEQPSNIRLAARAEAARLALDQKQPSRALDVLRQGRELAGELSAELDFAHVETYLALAKTGGQNNSGANWKEKALAMVQLLEQEHGPYWARRANLLLIDALPAAHDEANLDLLVRAADGLYLKGQLIEARQAYDKAARQARTAGDAAHAFELLYKAALVEQQRGQASDFAARCRQLALDMPELPGAPAAHFHAITTALEQARGDAAAMSLYETLLAEHTRLWPNSDSADLARLWSGQLAESRGNWQEAAFAYRNVRIDGPHVQKALEALARSWQQHLRTLDAQDPTLREQALAAARDFERVVTGQQGQLPERWSPVARTATLHAARIRLQFTTDSFGAVARLLEAALHAAPPPDPAWVQQATALRVVALAGQPGQREQARALLAQLGEQPPAETLELISQLAHVARNVPALKRDAARLQLDALQTVRQGSEQLDAEQQLELIKMEAAALAAAGERQAALQRYEQLAKQFPQDGDIQQQFAYVLGQGTDRASLEQALQQWRLVAVRSRPRTHRWFQAKLEVARTMCEMGQRQEAAQLIQYLQATADVDQSPLAEQFRQLLARCQSP